MSTSALEYLIDVELRELAASLDVLDGSGGPEPHSEYQDRPEDWIVEKLGIPRHTLRWGLNPGYRGHRWDGTKEPLCEILEGLANGEDVGVESATGTGKSFLGACIALWFLACWKDSIVNTYAPKEDQLRLYIWKEIAELWPTFQSMFSTAERVDLRIRMNGTDKWSAHGIATAVRAEEESATKAQGAHAAHMLLIAEETPGIDPAIMRALRNTRSGAHNPMLALGNPDNQQDALHRFCVLPDTTHVVMSALDHPNVVTGNPETVPGAASPAGVRRIAAEDEPGTPMYESRVRGISPAESTDALIKLAWVHAAAARYDAMLAASANLPLAMGVDVANSEKGDKGSKALGRGPCLLSVTTKPCPNANLLGAEVFTQANESGIDPAHIGVDPVGVGAGTVNEMARLGMEPRRLGGSLSPVNGAERAPDGSLMDFVPDANLFLNLRSQMAWQLREDFRKGGIALDPTLMQRIARQLTAPKFEKKGGKVVVEEKVLIKKRLGHSPDDFDSVMYWNWVRPRSPVVKEHESGDHEHPGYDYKAKRRLRKTARVTEDGTLATLAEDDLRSRMYFGGERFRMPRWNDASEEEGL